MQFFKHFLNFHLISLFICQCSLASQSQAVFDRSSPRTSGLFDNEPDLFLTVSSEPDCPHRRWYKPWSWFTETKCDRRLELNWINFDKTFPSTRDLTGKKVHDYVGVFQWDPTSNTSPQPPPPPSMDHRCPVTSISQAASGYFKTTLRYNKQGFNQKLNKSLTSGGLKSPCILGYWIAYVRTIRESFNSSYQSIKINPLEMPSTSSAVKEKTMILKSNCLRVRPFWMHELKEVIGELPVTSLMIPGTHNSGSWEAYKGLLQSEINLLSAYEIT